MLRNYFAKYFFGVFVFFYPNFQPRKSLAGDFRTGFISLTSRRAPLLPKKALPLLKSDPKLGSTFALDFMLKILSTSSIDNWAMVKVEKTTTSKVKISKTFILFFLIQVLFIFCKEKKIKTNDV